MVVPNSSDDITDTRYTNRHQQQQTVHPFCLTQSDISFIRFLLHLGQPHALHQHALYPNVDKMPSAGDHGLLTCNKQNKLINTRTFIQQLFFSVDELEIFDVKCAITFTTVSSSNNSHLLSRGQHMPKTLLNFVQNRSYETKIDANIVILF